MGAAEDAYRARQRAAAQVQADRQRSVADQRRAALPEVVALRDRALAELRRLGYPGGDMRNVVTKDRSKYFARRDRHEHAVAWSIGSYSTQYLGYDPTLHVIYLLADGRIGRTDGQRVAVESKNATDIHVAEVDAVRAGLTELLARLADGREPR